MLPELTTPEPSANQDTDPLAIFPDTTASSAISVDITAPEAICSAVMLPLAIAN